MSITKNHKQEHPISGFRNKNLINWSIFLSEKNDSGNELVFRSDILLLFPRKGESDWIAKISTKRKIIENNGFREFKRTDYVIGYKLKISCDARSLFVSAKVKRFRTKTIGTKFGKLEESLSVTGVTQIAGTCKVPITFSHLNWIVMLRISLYYLSFKAKQKI